MNNIVGAVIKEILEIAIMFTLYIDIFLKHKKLGVKSKIMGMFGTWSDGLVVKALDF